MQLSHVIALCCYFTGHSGGGGEESEGAPRCIYLVFDQFEIN